VGEGGRKFRNGDRIPTSRYFQMRDRGREEIDGVVKFRAEDKMGERTREIIYCLVIFPIYLFIIIIFFLKCVSKYSTPKKK
jgi:hypothetical protein